MKNKSFITNLLEGVKKRIIKIRTNPYKKVNLNWARLKYYKHLSSGELRTHYLFGKQLYFYSPTELLHGLHEIFIEEIYLQKLKTQPYIIDCGANIGLSIIYMKKLFPDAEIVAFEPDEVNFELLEKNINSFGYSNVSLKKEAVWIEDTTLHFSNAGSMASKIVSETNDNSTKPTKAVRLKNFLTKEIDFLKIDIEGAECEVVNDITDKLYLIKNMFVEYHGTFSETNKLIQLFNIIKNAGFSLYIKEAANIYMHPFNRTSNPNTTYDVQLNIFCFKEDTNK